MQVEILETHGSIAEGTFEVILSVGQYLVFTRQRGHQMHKGYAEDTKGRRAYVPQSEFVAAIRAANLRLNSERAKISHAPEKSPATQLQLFP